LEKILESEKELENEQERGQNPEPEVIEISDKDEEPIVSQPFSEFLVSLSMNKFQKKRGFRVLKAHEMPGGTRVKRKTKRVKKVRHSNV
jgi:hypothetical protein